MILPNRQLAAAPSQAGLCISNSLPQASRLVFGCMGFGGGWNAQAISGQDVARAQAAVEAALEIGITLFDHADIYTLGKAEQCFGALFRQQPGLRERLLLQSKCGIRFADAQGPKRYDLSAAHIIGSVEASLRRLNTDYLDLLLLHRPDPLIRADEVAEAWSRLKSSGKARHLGVSNMHAGHLHRLSHALGGEPLVVNQLELSLRKLDWLDSDTCFNDSQGLAVGTDWAGTLDHCRQHKVQIQAWGALAKGWFSGALPADAAPAARQTAALVQELADLHQVARESIVLAWLMKHPAGIQPVIGTSEPLRIRVCAAAATVQLSREAWYRLYVTARGGELP